MSYILDALKKSEQDRNRGEVPDWQSSHTSQVSQGENKQKVVIYTIAAVVVMGFVGSGVWWMQQQRSGSKVTVNKVASNKIAFNEFKGTYEKALSAKPSTQKQKNNTSTRSLNPEVGEARSKTPLVIFATEPLDETTPVPGYGNSNTTDNKSTLNTESIDIVEISQLPDEIQRNVPEIVFSGHVYSSKSQQRSVMINGKKMRERETISANFAVYKITKAGAVFNYDSWYFRLSALQDWSYEEQ